MCRVGHTGMSVKHLAENCISAANNVVEHVKGKWSNVLSISVKSTQSVALPFYSKTPAELVQLFQYPSVNKKRTRDEEDEDNNADDEVVIEQDAKKVRSRETKDAAKEKKPKSPLLAALKKQRLSSKLDKEQETLKVGSISVQKTLGNNATEKKVTSKPAKKSDSATSEESISKEKTTSSSKSALLLESKVTDKKKSSRKSAKPAEDVDATTSLKLKKRNTVPPQTR